jgi:hypothetical protein
MNQQHTRLAIGLLELLCFVYVFLRTILLDALLGILLEPLIGANTFHKSSKGKRKLKFLEH